jgi:hypothetical protein
MVKSECLYITSKNYKTYMEKSAKEGDSPVQKLLFKIFIFYRTAFAFFRKAKAFVLKWNHPRIYEP